MTDLINRQARVYGPPATLDAKDPEWDIRASYGPTPWQQQHHTSVRGVRVDKLSRVEGSDGFNWCLFPDGRVMAVRETNIHAVKLSKYTGAIPHDQQQAA